MKLALVLLDKVKQKYTDTPLKIHTQLCFEINHNAFTADKVNTAHYRFVQSNIKEQSWEQHIRS